MAIMTGEGRYIEVYILKSREKIKACFDSYVQGTESRTNKMVRRIHTDNAPEFLQMKREFERICIILTMCSSYNPQAHGLVDSIKEILLDKAWSMIVYSGLKLTFRADVIWHASDLHNKKLTVEQGSRNPMEALHGKTSYNCGLRVF